MSKMPAKKKSCFQITSVTTAQVATSITEDTESLDDPDESRTEDVSSEIFDVSRATDYGPEEVCERSSSEETLNNVGEAETPGTVSPNPVPDGQLAAAPAGGGGAVAARSVAGALAGTLAAAAAAAPGAPPAAGPCAGPGTAAPPQPPAACSSRFRVIKLDHGSGEPYRRGRWTCMEYYERDSDSSVLTRSGDCIRHSSTFDQTADRDSGLGATGGSVVVLVASVQGAHGPDSGPDSCLTAVSQLPPSEKGSLPAPAPPPPAGGAVAPGSAPLPPFAGAAAGPPSQPQGAGPGAVPPVPSGQGPTPTAVASAPPGPAVPPQFAYPQPQVPPGHLLPGQLSGPTEHLQQQPSGPGPNASSGTAQVAAASSLPGEALAPGPAPCQPAAGGGGVQPGLAPAGVGPGGPHAVVPGVPNVPAAVPAPSVPSVPTTSVTMPTVPAPLGQPPQRSSHAAVSGSSGVVQPGGPPLAQGTPSAPASLPQADLSQFQTQPQPSVGQFDDARRKSEPLPQPPLSLVAENKPVVKPPAADSLANPLQLTPMNSLTTSVFSIAIPVDGDEDSASGGGGVAIDNKIEQAMDLVKSHLMYAVREEVEVLKEQIKELVERNSLLERENALLKSLSNNEQLSQLPAPQAGPSGQSQAQPPAGAAQPPQPNVSSA
ncbi:TSC22 domain family protein 2 isoform 2-T2 [Rhynchonycteris naso]